MRLSTRVKICGIKDEDSFRACLGLEQPGPGANHQNMADYIGFVFYQKSPRYITPQNAANLLRKTDDVKPPTIVGLFVDPDIQNLQNIISAVPLDMIQLHGQETVDDVLRIRDKFQIPVIKAIRLSSREDLNSIKLYKDITDYILLDGGAGDGKKFDWQWLEDYLTTHPKNYLTDWFLAGGLNCENVAEAITKLRPPIIDVSSGVEHSRGQKSPKKIRNFLNIAKTI